MITCGGVLINLAGEVKIGNVKEFQIGGNKKVFLDSFYRLLIMLMDKERGLKAQIGLLYLD